MPELVTGALEARGPSAVGLTRLSTRLAFPPGAEALYRAILRLVDLTPESEFLLVPCGRGKGAVFLAESTGAAGAGSDPDARMVAVATDRAKAARLTGRLHFEAAPVDDLPYQDDVFDLVIGELEIGAARDPAAALRELARVTRPGGTVALIQMVWQKTPPAAQREALVQRLGVRPHVLVEWKQMLKDAGVADLHVEDWSNPAGSQSRPSALGGLTALFTVGGKLRLLPRAWERWGWRGVGAVLSRDQEMRRVIEEERVLGVSLIMGVRAADPQPEEPGEEHQE